MSNTATARLFERVVAPVTPSVPATMVLPVAAATVNLFVFTARSLVTASVPPTLVLPVEAVTTNLFVFTATSPVTPRVPATVVLPLAAVTVNLFVFTERSPATVTLPSSACVVEARPMLMPDELPPRLSAFAPATPPVSIVNAAPVGPVIVPPFTTRLPASVSFPV